MKNYLNRIIGRSAEEPVPRTLVPDIPTRFPPTDMPDPFKTTSNDFPALEFEHVEKSKPGTRSVSSERQKENLEPLPNKTRSIEASKENKPSTTPPPGIQHQRRKPVLKEGNGKIPNTNTSSERGRKSQPGNKEEHGTDQGRRGAQKTTLKGKILVSPVPKETQPSLTRNNFDSFKRERGGQEPHSGIRTERVTKNITGNTPLVTPLKNSCSELVIRSQFDENQHANKKLQHSPEPSVQPPVREDLSHSTSRKYSDNRDRRRTGKEKEKVIVEKTIIKEIHHKPMPEVKKEARRYRSLPTQKPVSVISRNLSRLRFGLGQM